MSEAQIRYAKASDGVSIAYAQAGSGPAFLFVPFVLQTHVQRMWSFAGGWPPKLAERFSVTSYDARGTGLSEREASDFSLEAMMRDVDAFRQQVLRSIMDTLTELRQLADDLAALGDSGTALLES